MNIVIIDYNIYDLFQGFAELLLLLLFAFTPRKIGWFLLLLTTILGFSIFLVLLFTSLLLLLFDDELV